MEPGDGSGAAAAAEAFFVSWSIEERKEKPVQFLREVVVRFRSLFFFAPIGT
jgi:hypothetical protein